MLIKSYSLKSIRINRGLTLEEAACLIGISKSTLFNYEHFKTTPDQEKIKKMMEVYDVEFDEIRFLPNEKEKKLAVKRSMKV